MTEPCDLSAVEARRMIGARQLSPVELLDSCLRRIGAVNHAVNAMVALDEERARAAAKAAGDAMNPAAHTAATIVHLGNTWRCLISGSSLVWVVCGNRSQGRQPDKQSPHQKIEG